MNDKIIIGDEVQRYSKKGEPLLGTRFIVTDMGKNYLSGIDFGGSIYLYEPEDMEEHEWLSDWKKTGRHYDIIGVLHKLRDEGE